MSKTQERRRDEETRVSAGHLGQAHERNEEEDWGDVPPPKTGGRGADPDLDEELAQEESADGADQENQVTATATEPRPKIDTASALQQIEQLRNNIPALVQALQDEINNIGSERKNLDEKEKEIKSRINFLRVLGGQSPGANTTASEAPQEEEQVAPRRRGRRRRGTAAPVATVAPPKGGKRHKNEQTLKEAICEAMATMTHPTTGTQRTGFVNDITKEVLKVYKTTSAKPTNTVRIQMYRLEEDNKVRQNDDGSYTLRKSVANELAPAAAE